MRAEIQKKIIIKAVNEPKRPSFKSKLLSKLLVSKRSSNLESLTYIMKYIEYLTGGMEWRGAMSPTKITSETPFFCKMTSRPRRPSPILLLPLRVPVKGFVNTKSEIPLIENWIYGYFNLSGGRGRRGGELKKSLGSLWSDGKKV